MGLLQEQALSRRQLGANVRVPVRRRIGEEGQELTIALAGPEVFVGGLGTEPGVVGFEAFR
ncbi:hypothetical protein [Streptomyces niveus]|uniref:Uncharacterized protein n=1 Tax=Streptomyces niveus TaxID=193462 RepID=A0ABZ2AHP1_STRNV|nr:hypothetical protein [Streptomyces niveus]WTA57005.1 hypothetical protein OG211_00210 [Streptomyces niveus]